MHDVSNIWRVPLLMQSQDAHVTICKQLGLAATAAMIDMHAWKTGIADRWDSLAQTVRIVLIGKYTVLSDAYLSVIKALQHACMAAGLKLQLDWCAPSGVFGFGLWFLRVRVFGLYWKPSYHSQQEDGS